MSKVPLVSVCIQTYQHAPFIAECLESVLAQKTDFPFEIILGEDESDDGTRELCIEYAEKHPDKIKLFLRSRADVIHWNGKPTGRFNMMQNLHAARGKYIAILEGDDYWCDPHKLQKQVDFLETNPAFVACHHGQLVTEKNEHGVFQERSWKDAAGPPPTEGTVSDLLSWKLRPQSRTIVFRNVFKEHSFPYWFRKVRFGDIALSFTLAQFGKFHYMDESMAVYRITNVGASSVFKTPNGRVQGNLAWLQLWGYALKMHDNKYQEDAMEGFKVILDRLKKSKIEYPQSQKSVRRFIQFKLKAPISLKLKLLRDYKG